MIIRILGEGQWDVPQGQLDRLNQLDEALEQAIAAEDEPAFADALAALLDGVRTGGGRVADEELRESDLILPPSDATLGEVRELLNDDGLIPG